MDKLTTMPGKNILRLDEVAAELRVSVRTVRRFINKGELKACRVNGALRITREGLEDWISLNIVVPRSSR